MLCIPITGPEKKQAEEQISLAEKIADLLEFRLDLLQSEPEQSEKKPVIRSQGTSPIDQQSFGNKTITAYHDFKKTPKDLVRILRKLRKDGAELVKIATMANSSLDAMRMLQLVQRNENIIGHCMGEIGQFTRIVSPIVGSAVTYAALDEDSKTAPGQLTAKELIETYHFPNFNQETRIFALLGNPVDQSIAHQTHNRVICNLRLNAVYVKIPVLPEELEEFLEMAKTLPFEGFSVTMPLKEKILEYVDHFERDSKKIGAVNTLRIKPDGIHACNTDGIGTLDAIEKHIAVEGKRVVILGAGGAAKAIAHEAKDRGAEIFILNRTPDRAKELAEKVEGKWFGLDAFAEVAKQGYDVLINATSASMGPDYDPVINPEHLLQDKVMMDVVYHPVETPFLIEGKKRGCALVYGTDMFSCQAVHQFTFWFSDHIST